MQKASGCVPGAFQCCPGQHRRRLAVDGHAAPADQKRAQREILRRGGQSLHGADAEQPRRDRGEQAAEYARRTELPQQSGGNEKRQQRRHDFFLHWKCGYKFGNLLIYKERKYQYNLAK